MRRLFALIYQTFAPLGIPLAWRQLSLDRKRFATAVAGVTFGFVLMFFQLGLYTAFLRQVVFPHTAMKGDLVITSRNFDYFYVNRPFPRHILYQAQGVRGVISVAPLWVDFVKWRDPSTGRERNIGILGVNPAQNPFSGPDLANQIHLLNSAENVLFDRRSKAADFGDVIRAVQEHGETVAETEHIRARVKGLFSMGQTLAATGHIIMSDEGLVRVHPQNSANMINIGLISLEAGVDPGETRRHLVRILPPEVRIMTAGEFQKEEQDYWMSRTAIGFICLAGMMVGMFVGAIVVYQILYTDVTDHLREYATLKAMGITDKFLLRVVLTEAMILMVASSIPSTILASVLFHLARTSAGIPTRLALGELLGVFGLAAAVCIISGLLATRKLKTADPADIY